MVKIQKIKINGIRGFKSIKLEDGNVSPKIIDILGKNCVVLGENGSGKSSLYDALEWCITGDCKEASYRRINPCNSFLKNKTCNFSSEIFVELDFEDDHKLSRKLSNSSAFCSEIVEPSQNGIKHDFLDASFIDVNRIDKFVLEAPSNLWKAFSELLNFEEIRNFDKKLLKLNSDISKRFEEIKLKYDSIKTTKENLEQEITHLRENLLTEIGENWETKKETILQQENKITLFKNLSDYLTLFFELLEKSKKYSEFKIEKEKEIANLNISIDALKLNIINSAEEYFTKNTDLIECPICHNKNIDPKKIKEELSQLKQKNAINSKLMKDVSENKVLLSQGDIEINKLLTELRTLFMKLDFSKYITKESDAQIKLLIDKKDELQNLIKETSSANIILIRQFEEKNDKLIKSTKQFIDVQNEYTLLAKVSEDITKYQKLFAKKYKDKIREELDKLSNNKVFKVYNAINKSLNDELITGLKIEVSNLDDTNPQIDFKIKINNVFENAVDHLSTGHLKCLGFALLIAKFELKKPKINTLIIDDPVYAIDHEHRYNLINYFYKLSEEGIQLIIFSSDRLFFEILVNTLKKESFISYEVENTLEQGVNYKEIKSDFLEKAKHHLKNKDIRSTSLYSRLALEQVLFKAAKELNIKTRFRQEIGMSQLIFEYNIEQELKNKYPDKITDLDSVFIDLKQPRCTKILLGRFSLDHELHEVHEDRDSYTITEVSEAVKHIENFIDTINRVLIKKEK